MYTWGHAWSVLHKISKSSFLHLCLGNNVGHPFYPWAKPNPDMYHVQSFYKPWAKIPTHHTPWPRVRMSILSLKRKQKKKKIKSNPAQIFVREHTSKAKAAQFLSQLRHGRITCSTLGFRSPSSLSHSLVSLLPTLPCFCPSMSFLGFNMSPVILIWSVVLKPNLCSFQFLCAWIWMWGIFVIVAFSFFFFYSLGLLGLTRFTWHLEEFFFFSFTW